MSGRDRAEGLADKAKGKLKEKKEDVKEKFGK